jgi:hypothetical protein
MIFGKDRLLLSSQIMVAARPSHNTRQARPPIHVLGSIGAPAMNSCVHSVALLADTAEVSLPPLKCCFGQESHPGHAGHRSDDQRRTNVQDRIEPVPRLIASVPCHVDWAGARLTATMSHSTYSLMGSTTIGMFSR